MEKHLINEQSKDNLSTPMQQFSTVRNDLCSSSYNIEAYICRNKLKKTDKKMNYLQLKMEDKGTVKLETELPEQLY